MGERVWIGSVMNHVCPLTKLLPTLKRACNVLITASSVNGPGRWIRSSMSLGSVFFCVCELMRFGDTMRGFAGSSTSVGMCFGRLPPFGDESGCICTMFSIVAIAILHRC